MVAGVEAPLQKGASIGEVSIIGLDLAKNVFQAHGAGADGSVVFRRKLARAQLLKFIAAQPPCVVAMEACASSHHWGWVIGDLGHEVRLIPPAYVKPFVKRQKNDMADAEAIAEAASRPTMRFVAVKSEAQQTAAMAYRTRDLLVRQRTQTINALRAHLAEQGIVAPTGPAQAPAAIGTGIGDGAEFHFHRWDVVRDRTTLRFVLLLDVRQLHPRGHRGGRDLAGLKRQLELFRSL
jgi:hypothetical protein